MGMKYSLKGHKDRNRHKNRMKRSGQRSAALFQTQTVTSPPREGEPVGTRYRATVAHWSSPYLAGESPRALLHVVGMLRFNRACPLLFNLFLCQFLSLWPFQPYFIPWILPTTLRFLTLFSRSYFCLTGPFNCVMSLYESLLQPWYNPLWLTGLKAPTNQLTNLAGSLLSIGTGCSEEMR